MGSLKTEIEKSKAFRKEHPCSRGADLRLALWLTNVFYLAKKEFRYYIFEPKKKMTYIESFFRIVQFLDTACEQYLLNYIHLIQDRRERRFRKLRKIFTDELLDSIAIELTIRIQTREQIKNLGLEESIIIKKIEGSLHVAPVKIQEQSKQKIKQFKKLKRVQPELRFYYKSIIYYGEKIKEYYYGKRKR